MTERRNWGYTELQLGESTKNTTRGAVSEARGLGLGFFHLTVCSAPRATQLVLGKRVSKGWFTFITEQLIIAHFSCRPNTGKETQWLTPSRGGAVFQLWTTVFIHETGEQDEREGLGEGRSKSWPLAYKRTPQSHYGIRLQQEIKHVQQPCSLRPSLSWFSSLFVRCSRAPSRGKSLD